MNRIRFRATANPLAGNPSLSRTWGGGSTIDTVMSCRGAFPFSAMALAH